MPKRSVSELPFCRLDGTREFPPLGDANNSILAGDANLIQSIDNCTDAIRIERHGAQETFLVDSLRQLGDVMMALPCLLLSCLLRHLTCAIDISCVETPS